MSQPLYISQAGPHLLETPLLNKGSAFSAEERLAFNLVGLLPPRHETIQEQAERSYQQYQGFQQPIQKHIFLRALQDNNETLFYRLLKEHLEEMLPLIYTPTVGDACEYFSHIYRSARGLFVSPTDLHQMGDLIHSAIKRQVKVIVITDGERVLGLGDQGIGGMGISIGKLSLYTAAGGISPAYTLPVCLDVGTDNPKLQSDPFYMGLRTPRLRGEAYYELVEAFIEAAVTRWPGVLIQFEDFAQTTAMPLLTRWRHRICAFNDDIQGTAAVTVGTLLAACRKQQRKLRDCRAVFVGSGSAGCGIAEALIRQMKREGLAENQARAQVFMVDRHGLLTTEQKNLRDFQTPLAQPPARLMGWSVRGAFPSLLETVSHARPHILVGVSGVPGLFTEEVTRTMAAYCPQPILFPLSNPVKQIEAHPHDLLQWTQGQALVATGSPFGSVEYGGKSVPIAQCNNSYIFPGIGLAVVACGATQISDGMLASASATLAEATLATDKLLPPLSELGTLSKRIAYATAKVAMDENHARRISDVELSSRIEKNFWVPHYRTYRRSAN